MLRIGQILLPVLLAACGSPESHLPQEAESADQTPDVVASAGTSSPAPAQEHLPPPRHAWVIFGADTVLAEVARTADERAQGLMYRESLSKGKGLIFVFPESRIQSFWMKDTFIPLDIAYLDADLRIVDIQAMEPESVDPHPSALPAMFALEVPLGWFGEMGIGVGAQARLVFGPG